MQKVVKSEALFTPFKHMGLNPVCLMLSKFPFAAQVLAISFSTCSPPVSFSFAEGSQADYEAAGGRVGEGKICLTGRVCTANSLDPMVNKQDS